MRFPSPSQDGEPAIAFTTDNASAGPSIVPHHIGGFDFTLEQPGATAAASGLGTGALLWQAGEDVCMSSPLERISTQHAHTHTHTLTHAQTQAQPYVKQS